LSRFSVICLDMAGTTVRDGNSVMGAFAAAIASRNLTARGFNGAMKYARATMGQSKIEVFRHILGEEDAAQAANETFEKHYAGAVAGGEISPMPGAVELFAACRAAGTRVCLSTGFAPVTRDAIVDALGWHPLVDLLLSPADAGRGRPWPDMPLTALLRLGGGAVRELLVAGDTPSDIESGLRAGAGVVAGVTTGASGADELAAAGAPHVLDSVTGLVQLLGIGAATPR
jgi:phosphoglycolate phosphatase